MKESEKLKEDLSTSGRDLEKRLDQISAIIGDRKTAAAIMEISEAQLYRYLKGQGVPPLNALVRLAKKADVTLEWLATGEGPMRVGESQDAGAADMIAIPEYSVEGSAGHGVVLSAEELESVWWFSRKLALEMGLNPANLAFIKVRGDSMMPNIRNGDLVLIDLTQKRFDADAIYAFILGDMLLVKRIQAMPAGEYQAKSDNPAYSPTTLKPGAEPVTVVGRVVYAIHSLL